MSETRSFETPRRNLLARCFSRLDDGTLMRTAFIGVLLGAGLLLGMDLREMVDRNGGLWPSGGGVLQPSTPLLPPAVHTGTTDKAMPDPRRFITADGDTLSRPISFTLKADGLLEAVGSIEQGAAQRLEAELETRGEYVTLLSLNSPGGALDDAMAMARMLRERGIGTIVEDGALCASSCPLLMAGGVTREAGGEAAIGLHQFYVAADAISDPAQAMADAQLTTARIARHLEEMGVDSALWLHALDTPPRALYYLSAEEMQEYRLTTGPRPLASN